MRKLLLIAAAVLLVSVNAPAEEKNPAPASAPADQPAAKSASQDTWKDTGVRKLSRRERKDAMKNLSDKYRQFISDVEPIMQPSELDAFLVLESDAQRDRFIEDFWARRDPNGGSNPNNVYRDNYYDRLSEARTKFKLLNSDRARMYLIQGEPLEVRKIDCDKYLVPIELWHYGFLQGLGHDVDLIFYVPRNGSDYRLWQPMLGQMESLAELLSVDGEMQGGVQNVFFNASDPRIPSRVATDCQYGDELMRAIFQVQQNRLQLGALFVAPKVKEEDVERMLRSSVISDPNATKLTGATMTSAFPARRGGMTVVEVTVMLPKSQLQMKELDGVKYYNVDLTGEMVRDNKVFENFRYRFDYPVDTPGDKLPVVFERYLRPADYLARVKVMDSNSRAEAIVEQKITVPYLAESAAKVEGEKAATATLDKVEAEIVTGENTLRIVPLGNELLNGLQHIETIISGDAIKAVEFYLDGRKVMTKRTAPYVLDLDLGNVPQPRRIKAVGLDAKGTFVSGDEIIVNAGTDPYHVRIVSPRVAMNLKGKVRVEIDAAPPDGKKLKSVELFLNETRLATLYSPPYVQTVTIPDNAGIGYLRAVATVNDSAVQPVEDVVFINTPEYLQEIEVHLVELPTTVINNGRHVDNLPQSAFKVLDEGKEAKIAKFEYVKNLPLSLGLAIDTSASMRPRMTEAQRAGINFFKNVLKPGDKAFEVSFDSEAAMVQKWTTSLPDLNAGLASLRAEESTALYDAIVASLYEFRGVKGQKALVVITDGQDTASKFTFDQALEFARRAAVPIYVIAIGLRPSEIDAKFKMQKFTSETGGTLFSIEQAGELAKVYDTIQNELRSQYIIGIYPPGDVKPGSKWRDVNVLVNNGKAKTVRGYYP